MKLSRGPSLFLFLLIFSGCAALLAPARSHWPPLPNGFFMNVGGFIQITGTGKAEGVIDTVARRKSIGRDAALLDAWERARRYLGAFVLPNGLRVAERAAMDEEYAKRFEALIHGAKIVSTQYDQDQTAVVVLRLERRKIQEVLGTDYK